MIRNTKVMKFFDDFILHQTDVRPCDRPKMDDEAAAWYSSAALLHNYLPPPTNSSVADVAAYHCSHVAANQRCNNQQANNSITMAGFLRHQQPTAPRHLSHRRHKEKAESKRWVKVQVYKSPQVARIDFSQHQQWFSRLVSAFYQRDLWAKFFANIKIYSLITLISCWHEYNNHINYWIKLIHYCE